MTLIKGTAKGDNLSFLTIKTGLNDAFVVNRATRDAIVEAGRNSEELLKPFLRGENIKRWRLEAEDLFLINTPRSKVDIEAYPAVKSWLLPFKERLEHRATQQQWWELQQAQLAYQGQFLNGGIAFPDLSQGPKFSRVKAGYLPDCTAFYWPNIDSWGLSYLNSRLVWFVLYGSSNPMRGGR